MNGAIDYRLMTKIVSALILILSSTLSLAEKNPGFQWNIESQLRYDDNVYRTSEQSTESKTFFIIKPKLHWLSLYGKHLFELSYRGEYGSLQLDHHLKAYGLLDHSYRLNSEYTLGINWRGDRPGKTDALSISSSSLNQSRDIYTKGKIYYGHNDSQGQLQGQLDYHQRRYTNNNQEYRDYNRLGTIGTFYYRVAPKTRMLFELSFTDYAYLNSDTFGKNQSNQVFRYLTGVTWEATSKTTGIFKIGYQDKIYTENTFDDLSALALMLNSTWKPNTYTTITIDAVQENQESAQESSRGYLRRHINAGLEHFITPRTQLLIKVGYGIDQFDNAFNREDDRWNLQLSIKRSLLRWLYIGAEYQYEERNSNLDIYDFNANVYMLTIGTDL